LNFVVVTFNFVKSMFYCYVCSVVVLLRYLISVLFIVVKFVKSVLRGLLTLHNLCKHNFNLMRCCCNIAMFDCLVLILFVVVLLQ